MEHLHSRYPVSFQVSSVRLFRVPWASAVLGTGFLAVALVLRLSIMHSRALHTLSELQPSVLVAYGILMPGGKS